MFIVKIAFSYLPLHISYYIISGLIGAAFLTSSGHISLESEAFSALGSSCLLPNLQGLDLDPASLQLLVRDAASVLPSLSLPAPGDLLQLADHLSLALRRYADLVLGAAGAGDEGDTVEASTFSPDVEDAQKSEEPETEQKPSPTKQLGNVEQTSQDDSVNSEHKGGPPPPPQLGRENNDKSKV